PPPPPPPPPRKTALPRIVAGLRLYAAGYLASQARPLHRLAREVALPTPLAWAALRGEGLIRLRFCHCFENLGFSWQDGERLMQLWPRLGCHSGLVFDLLARAGVFSALSTQFKLPEPSPELAWQLYCGIVDALDRDAKTDLLALITDDFWLHHWRIQFPEEAGTPATPSLTVLRQRLQKALQTRHKLPVDLRERFSSEAAEARFHLRYRLCPPGPDKGPWIELPEHTGTRLKPLKLAAYQKALETAQSD
ncbi:MAG: hypothetical protein Q8Q28_18320, partial [Pseudomonadota bacterium]|nr:hypothetical protein [Pseudomonadota bacterium]